MTNHQAGTHLGSDDDRAALRSRDLLLSRPLARLLYVATSMPPRYRLSLAASTTAAAPTNRRACSRAS